MAENTTTPHQGKVSSLYRAGDIVIFKYEGNLRAHVTGHRLIDGKVWLEAETSLLSFVIPSSEIIGTEPREDD
jgi:hypothetical protein